MNIKPELIGIEQCDALGDDALCFHVTQPPPTGGFRHASNFRQLVLG